MLVKQMLRSLVLAGLVSLVSMGVMVSTASAVGAPASAWAIASVATPTNFTESDSEHCLTFGRGTACDAYIVSITNVGSAPSSGTIIVRDKLPHGIVIAGVGEDDGGCPEEPGASSVACVVGEPIAPGSSISIEFEVKSTPEAASLVTNVAEVEGGGAPSAVTSLPSTQPNPVNAMTPTPFGTQSFSGGAYERDGTLDVQAGGHPALLSTTIDYTTLLNPASFARGSTTFRAVQEPKTEIVDLPPGLVGNPQAAAECPEADLVGVEKHPEQCPASSVVGNAVIDTSEGPVERSIYSVVPESGYPAEFAFEFNAADIYLRARLLPTARGYVLSVSVPDIIRSTNIWVDGAAITFFGDPTEHDGSGNGKAFLTNPDECDARASNATLEMDSWVQPENWVSPGEEHEAGIVSPLTETPLFDASASHAVTGCSSLSFEPSIQVQPEQTTVDTPSGYEINLKIPQAPSLPGVLATPDLKDAVVRLPEGVSVSPSAANGLVACQASGPEGIELGAQDQVDADRIASEHEVHVGEMVQEGEELGVDGLVHPSPGHCPAASQVGEVEVFTPLLPQPLHGHVYVAEPQCGGTGQPGCTPASAANGELFGLYLEVAGSGVVVKLKGTVSANPTTGQLTTTFSEAPQLPFSELRLRLNGGSRAPLANPRSCAGFSAGPGGLPLAVSTSDLTPWSGWVGSDSGPDATPSSGFEVSGCGASAFAPGFLAQTANPAAGAYSPFTLTFSRHDSEQDLAGLTVNMPQGLLGRIAGFAQCGGAEVAAAENNTGGCPAGSRVGTATAAAGAGSTPFWQSGPVYLTGPYNGGPFGLAVVVPADAGPYRLGNIVVRAAIHIDPSTAAVTVVSNPGVGGIPIIKDGVPLRVRTVNVTVGGEAGSGTPFTFNPTNCAASKINATISSAQGASANVSTPFAAAGCAGLAFKPVLTASTAGKASKAGGASLDVRIVMPRPGPSSSATTQGGEADIAKVDLQIPKQLSSRLTTLQKACTEAQFGANPAGCPSASDIGSAVVHTPLLNSPLAGPVYLVSHGGAAFPDVEIVLQGEGVRLVVDGKTQIKKGVTYSHFETVPDAPFESFETKLPTGRYSIFGANLPEKSKYDFCGQTLQMPTELVGQNGAVIKQTTRVGVTGCPKVKAAKKKKKTAKKKKTQAKAQAKKAGRKAKKARNGGRR